MDTKKMVKELEERAKAVAEERDKLDEILSRYTDIRDHCDEAYERLVEAREILSQLV